MVILAQNGKVSKVNATSQFIVQPAASSIASCQDHAMIGYLIALLPLYIFVYLPLSNLLFGTQESSGKHVLSLNSSLIATNEPLACLNHKYNTYILSQEPLVIYIENFLSNDETKHLLDIRQVEAYFFRNTQQTRHSSD